MTAAKNDINSALMYRVFLLIMLLCGSIVNVQATHLVGGNVTYTYLGKTPAGKFRYKIRFDIFRDANSSTNYDPTVDLGIYSADPSNTAIINDVPVDLGDHFPVDPVSGGSACAGTAKAKLEGGYYETTIDLDASNYGYYITYVRCCRNTSVNLDIEQGQTYLCFIPAPNKLTNTSLQFLDSRPIPYVCVNDTVRSLYSATDADGDSLSYKFVRPYLGGDKNVPAPTPASNFALPGVVRYNSGYSYTQPFGSKGVANIDAVTGLATLYIPLTGRYVIAVEVTEWRNGKAISTTRRDIQIIAITCNPSPAPSRVDADTSPSGNVTIKPNNRFSYTIEEGKTLGFPINYAGGDSLWLQLSGEIFDVAKFPKNVATGKNASGPKIAATYFNWHTLCGQARPSPYIFIAFAYNNACPRKFTNNTYQIYVTPVLPPKSIVGTTSACKLGVQKYAIGNPDTGYRYVWNVSGGLIITHNQDWSEVLVQWSDGSNGKLQVIKRNIYGCESDTFTQLITILPRPPKTSFSGKTVSCYNSIETYSVDKPDAKSQYIWNVDRGSISNATGTSVDVHWNIGDADTGTVKLVEINSAGCPGDTAYLKVVIDHPRIDSILGPQSVCPNARNIDYWIWKPSARHTYNWIITGGKQASGGQTDKIQVNWGNRGTGSVGAYAVSTFGCHSDTAILPVVIDYQLKTAPIKGDTSVCAFSKAVVYQTQYVRNSSFDWKILGGTITSGQGSNRITVDWDTARTAVLQVIQTAYDSINGIPCVATALELLVYIHPVPTTGAITGPKTICQRAIGHYSVKGMPGSTFIWTINGPDTIKGQGDTAIDIHFLHSGNYTLQVIELSKDSCFGFERSPTSTEALSDLGSAVFGSSLSTAVSLGAALASEVGLFSLAGTPSAGSVVDV